MKKKLTALFLAVAMCMTMSVPASAVSHETELTDAVLLTLSAEDHENCYTYLLQYKEDNPDCSNEELDAVAEEFYISVYNEKASIAAPNSWYDDLIPGWSSLNEEERELGRQYPSDLAALYTSSGIANTETESRYTAGFYLGNADAFRHAAWNALLICRFYALGKGDYEWCRARAQEWTTAHESGAEVDTNLSAAQREADHDMDLMNNAVGRMAAETTYTSEAAALRQVQEYVDDGYCKRIMTDAQIRADYEYEDMIAVSTWTIRTTNTVGKS